MKVTKMRVWGWPRSPWLTGLATGLVGTQIVCLTILRAQAAPLVLQATVAPVPPLAMSWDDYQPPDVGGPQTSTGSGTR